MTKGDIVIYTHRAEQYFYGVIVRKVSADGFAVDVLTNAAAQNWASSFTCHRSRLELLEAA